MFCQVCIVVCCMYCRGQSHSRLPHRTSPHTRAGGADPEPTAGQCRAPTAPPSGQWGQHRSTWTRGTGGETTGREHQATEWATCFLTGIQAYHVNRCSAHAPLIWLLVFSMVCWMLFLIIDICLVSVWLNVGWTSKLSELLECFLLCLSWSVAWLLK